MTHSSVAPENTAPHLSNAGTTLSVREQFLYALPTASISFLFAPVTSVLHGIYATYFGLSLAAIAMVLLIARIFDAVTDPVIGYLSDRYHARTGGRKAFMAYGVMLLIVSGYFLYVPVNPSSVDSSTQVSVAHFLVFYLLFYLGATLFEIPHQAWGSELTAKPAERNSLFSWRFALVSVGYVLFYVLPLLPFFDTSDITPQILQWTVLASSCLIIPITFISLKSVPNQCGPKNTIHTPGQTSHKPLRLTMLVSNRPLLLFLVTFIFTGIFGGMYMALLFIYVNSYLGLGEHFALALLIMFISGIVSVRFWNLIATNINKPCAWSIGTGLMLVSIVGISLLEPETASLQQFIIINILFGCGMAVGNIVCPSILSDIIDYSRWKYSTDCSASFFSVYCMAIKANVALGGALALFIAGWYGFDPAADVHSPIAIEGVRVAMIWLPVLIGLVSIVFIFLTPITERRHSIIRRCLALRERREKPLIPKRAETTNAVAENTIGLQA